jgi:hypothetical protein
MRRMHTYWLGSLVVRTVTGVPRREPWRPYGRTVSPERELQLLSVDPWRATVSFRVMVTGSRTAGLAMRRRAGEVRGAACAERPRTAASSRRDAVSVCAWAEAVRAGDYVATERAGRRRAVRSRRSASIAVQF